MDKIFVPFINLRKFYLVSTSNDIDKIRARAKISDRTINVYMKFREFLFGDKVKVGDFNEFTIELSRKITEKIISKSLLEELNRYKAPFNCIALKRLLERNGKEISISSAKALLSLLKKLNLIVPLPTFRIVESDEDLVYLFILRKGITTIESIKAHFSNASWVIDALLKIWSQNKIEIMDLDVPKEIYLKYGRYDIPVEVVKNYSSVNVYLDRRTGSKKAEIILNPKSKVIIHEIS